MHIHAHANQAPHILIATSAKVLSTLSKMSADRSSSTGEQVVASPRELTLKCKARVCVRWHMQAIQLIIVLSMKAGKC